MKKSLIAIAVVITSLISASAFAGSWGWGGGNQGFNFGGHGGFTGNVMGTSEAYGIGPMQQAKSFSMNEQAGIMNINAMKTVYGTGSPCQGTCDQNMSSVNFDLTQKVSAGAMHQAEGGNYASSTTNGNIQGSFDFGGILSGFGR